MKSSSYGKLAARLASGFPVVQLTAPSSDEMSVVEQICRQLQPRFAKYGANVWVYDVALGLRRAFVGSMGLSLMSRAQLEKSSESEHAAALREMPDDEVLDEFAQNPQTGILNWLHGTAEQSNGIFILLDFHPYLTPGSPNFNVGALRFVKSLADRLKRCKRRVILLSCDSSSSDELDGLVPEIANDLPDQAQVESLVNLFVDDARKAITDAGKKFTVELDSAGMGALVKECSMLTTEEIMGALRLAVYGPLVNGGKAAVNQGTIAAIADIKADKLRKLGVDLAPSVDVQPAGMHGWINWAEQAGKLFNLPGEQNTFNIEPPSGALLLGVPGSGKSLACKALAKQWGLKVARFDFGSLLDKYQGESERKLRQALAAFDKAGKIVVFIDEIEKALGGDQLDGGTNKRMVGSLLTWLQEKPAGVFAVATANDLDAINNRYPELLRSGRFDAIFWFDVPQSAERAEILAVHLQKRNSPWDDKKALLEVASNPVFSDFVGADLGQCVLDAAKLAFMNDADSITDRHLLAAAACIKPIARRNKQRLDQQRALAAQNYLMASPTPVHPSQGANSIQPMI